MPLVAASTSGMGGRLRSTLATHDDPIRTPYGGGVQGPARDPRHKCMSCHRKPSDYLVDESAPDGGWLWVCAQCYGRSRRGWAIIGRVGVARV